MSVTKALPVSHWPNGHKQTTKSGLVLVYRSYVGTCVSAIPCIRLDFASH